MCLKIITPRRQRRGQGGGDLDHLRQPLVLAEGVATSWQQESRPSTDGTGGHGNDGVLQRMDVIHLLRFMPAHLF